MVKELDLRVSPQVASSDLAIREWLVKESGFEPESMTAVRVLRRSIDARHKPVFVNLKVRVYENETPPPDEFTSTVYGDVSAAQSVVVVGAGPGGLFAALRLIELGMKPIVVERGKDVHARKRDLASIARTQLIDAESNYAFGEGGAGAFSDGKLYTRSKKRGNTEKILNVFCQHGASTDILADAHPHIGTDRLPGVIENMRHTIIRCGGEVHFQTKMTALVFRETTQGPVVAGIEAIDMAAGCERMFDGPVILATGHSARDMYQYLYNAGLTLEAKGIAVGVRLEHASHLIDQIQYHSKEGRGAFLPAAEYSFSTQVDGRGVYSFCMCPGGFVIPAATSPDQIVVNGMSPSHRGTRWSNSGMVVEVRPEDIHDKCFGMTDEELRSPLQMMRFQQKLEQMAWQQGNHRQTAPSQRMADFVEGHLSASLPASSYAPGTLSSPLHFWMPKPVASRLRQAFRKFGQSSRGFLTNEALVLGVETRTSSPVRIVRDPDTLQHINVRGLFPCGEGAGYAGGIVSAGVDGERCAESVAKYLSAS